MTEGDRGPRHVSVVVPTKNAGPEFGALLEAILRQRCPFPFDIWVIDSGSSDCTLDICAAYAVRVLNVLPESFNHGATRNAAIAATDGDLVALVVQDALPADDGWLAALIEPLSCDISVAGVYGLQIPRGEASALARQRNRQWYRGADQMQTQFIPDGVSWADLDAPTRLRLSRFDNVTSAIRRSVWASHPFRSLTYGEDVSWAREVLMAGHKLVFQPRARVFHSHDRGLDYEFRRAGQDAVTLANLTSETRFPSAPGDTASLARWLVAEARAFCAKTGGLPDPPDVAGDLLTIAAARWRAQLTSRSLADGGVPGADESQPDPKTVCRNAFDSRSVAFLIGPDSPYPPDERAWLQDELAWVATDEPTVTRELTRTFFDRKTLIALFADTSPCPPGEREGLLRNLYMERGPASESFYRQRFSAPVARSVLEKDWPWPAKSRLKLAAGWLQRSARSGLGSWLAAIRFALGTIPTESQLAGRSLAPLFSAGWSQSPERMRTAMAAILGRNLLAAARSGIGPDPSELDQVFDRLWDNSATSSVRQAIAARLRERLALAVTADARLSDDELEVLFQNLWRRIGRNYACCAQAQSKAEPATTDPVRKAMVEQAAALGALWAFEDGGEAQSRPAYWTTRLYGAATAVARQLAEASSSTEPGPAQPHLEGSDRPPKAIAERSAMSSLRRLLTDPAEEVRGGHSPIWSALQLVLGQEALEH